MSDERDDDGPVTEADLAAARERWADPEHEPSAPELFSRPAYGPGFRGDVPLRVSGAPPEAGGGAAQ